MNELERIEAQAVREAVVLGGGRSEMVGGAVCMQHPTVRWMEVNRAIAIGETVDIDAIAAWFDGPHTIGTRDDELGRELASRGYTRARSSMKFERDAAPATSVETDGRVEETFDSELFGNLIGANALGAVAGAPGWHCFVGWVGDEPAASGAFYADGTSAWLGVAFTREEFRGRGLQGALLAARIEAARAAGVTVMTAETGELQRAGFREAYLRANWTTPA